MQAGERCFLSLHKQQQRKNSESPYGESNLRPMNSALNDAPPQSHKDSMVSKAHYEVHVGHRSCKLYNLHVIKCNRKKFV